MKITLPRPLSKSEAPAFYFVFTATVCSAVFFVTAIGIALLVRSLFLLTGTDPMNGVPLVMVLVVLLGCYCADILALNSKKPKGEG